MGFFDFLKAPDFEEGLKRCQATPGSVLLDVREADEYADGHIFGSVNMPLSTLDGVEITIPDRDTPVFIYCLSGARSAQAVSRLRKMGYRQVVNIGGIRGYKGDKEELEEQIR